MIDPQQAFALATRWDQDHGVSALADQAAVLARQVVQAEAGAGERLFAPDKLYADANRAHDVVRDSLAALAASDDEVGPFAAHVLASRFRLKNVFDKLKAGR